MAKPKIRPATPKQAAAASNDSSNANSNNSNSGSSEKTSEIYVTSDTAVPDAVHAVDDDSDTEARRIRHQRHQRRGWFTWLILLILRAYIVFAAFTVVFRCPKPDYTVPSTSYIPSDKYPHLAEYVSFLEHETCASAAYLHHEIVLPAYDMIVATKAARKAAVLYRTKVVPLHARYISPHVDPALSKISDWNERFIQPAASAVWTNVGQPFGASVRKIYYEVGHPVVLGLGNALDVSFRTHVSPKLNEWYNTGLQKYNEHVRPVVEPAVLRAHDLAVNKVYPATHGFVFTKALPFYHGKVSPFVCEHVTPRLITAKNKASDITATYVVPGIRTAFIKTSDAAIMVSNGYIIPASQRAWVSAAAFYHDTVRPVVHGAYQTHVQPLVKQYGPSDKVWDQASESADQAAHYAGVGLEAVMRGSSVVYQHGNKWADSIIEWWNHEEEGDTLPTETVLVEEIAAADEVESEAVSEPIEVIEPVEPVIPSEPEPEHIPEPMPEHIPEPEPMPEPVHIPEHKPEPEPEQVPEPTVEPTVDTVESVETIVPSTTVETTVATVEATVEPTTAAEPTVDAPATTTASATIIAPEPIATPAVDDSVELAPEVPEPPSAPVAEVGSDQTSAHFDLLETAATSSAVPAVIEEVEEEPVIEDIQPEPVPESVLESVPESEPVAEPEPESVPAAETAQDAAEQVEFQLPEDIPSQQEPVESPTPSIESVESAEEVIETSSALPTTLPETDSAVQDDESHDANEPHEDEEDHHIDHEQDAGDAEHEIEHDHDAEESDDEREAARLSAAEWLRDAKAAISSNMESVRTTARPTTTPSVSPTPSATEEAHGPELMASAATVEDTVAQSPAGDSASAEDEPPVRTLRIRPKNNVYTMPVVRPHDEM
ncbi:hypothetical protein GQ42DRAFT_178413 [Ramicandelaber brevisporus]|nr:hypothetical protein GQ42DRAFT_178413 [Ramicandelaber brevisporus]